MKFFTPLFVVMLLVFGSMVVLPTDPAAAEFELGEVLEDVIDAGVDDWKDKREAERRRERERQRAEQRQREREARDAARAERDRERMEYQRWRERPRVEIVHAEARRQHADADVVGAQSNHQVAVVQQDTQAVTHISEMERMRQEHEKETLRLRLEILKLQKELRTDRDRTDVRHDHEMASSVQSASHEADRAYGPGVRPSEIGQDHLTPGQRAQRQKEAAYRKDRQQSAEE